MVITSTARVVATASYVVIWNSAVD